MKVKLTDSVSASLGNSNSIIIPTGAIADIQPFGNGKLLYAFDFNSFKISVTHTIGEIKGEFIEDSSQLWGDNG